jgi:hypothetical protein
VVIAGVGGVLVVVALIGIAIGIAAVGLVVLVGKTANQAAKPAVIAKPRNSPTVVYMRQLFASPAANASHQIDLAATRKRINDLQQNGDQHAS